MKNVVILSATVSGEGHSVECRVRATKSTLAGASLPPFYSNMSVVPCDAVNVLPDGSYEILVNKERFSVRRERGEFIERI